VDIRFDADVGDADAEGVVLTGTDKFRTETFLVINAALKQHCCISNGLRTIRSTFGYRHVYDTA